MTTLQWILFHWTWIGLIVGQPFCGIDNPRPRTLIVAAIIGGPIAWTLALCIGGIVGIGTFANWIQGNGSGRKE